MPLLADIKLRFYDFRMYPVKLVFSEFLLTFSANTPVCDGEVNLGMLGDEVDVQGKSNRFLVVSNDSIIVGPSVVSSVSMCITSYPFVFLSVYISV